MSQRCIYFLASCSCLAVIQVIARKYKYPCPRNADQCEARTYNKNNLYKFLLLATCRYFYSLCFFFFFTSWYEAGIHAIIFIILILHKRSKIVNLRTLKRLAYFPRCFTFILNANIQFYVNRNKTLARSFILLPTDC